MKTWYKGDGAMIRFTWYELLWLFFIYSFLGWVLETAAATVKQKKFANRGLVNGPFCVIYGIAALFMTFGLQELRGVWLFLFAAIYATVIEWVAGHLIEKAFKARWWDYSKIRWNLDGYICIPASLVWGALGYLGIRWGNRFAIVVFKMLPLFLMKILVLILLGILIVDILGSYLLLRGKGKNLARWEATNEGQMVAYAEYEYYMLNKPAGVVSATEDKNDSTVLDLIDEKQRKDLFPVGRLDKDTEGLLLITNDGELAHQLLSPKKHVDKVYFARIDGKVTEEDVRRFAEGLEIGEEKPTLPAHLEILKREEISEIRLTIREGKFHQVKRMFHAVGKEVIYLKRLQMGSLVLDPRLALGEYRELTGQELEALHDCSLLR